LLLALGLTTFKIVKDIQVFSWSKQIEKDVVLGADTHELTNLVHILKQIRVVARGLTLTFLDQASQH
jgi:hypothetical protein